MYKNYLVLILPYLISVLALGAVYFQIKEDGIGMVLYYSLWNNVMMALAPIFLRRVPYLLFTNSSLVLTVYGVYETYLMLFGGMDYPWWEYRNFVGHYLCPVLIIVWSYINKSRLQYPSFKIVSLPIVLYILFVIINILYIRMVAPLMGDVHPYFFMDASEYGILPTLALIIVLFSLLRIYFIIYKNKFLNNK